MFGRWGGARRWASVLALASVMALLAGACGGSSPRSQTGSRSSGSDSNGPMLSSRAATDVAVRTWVRHLASAVALDASTLPDSEAGFQLDADKLAIPIDLAEGQHENQYQPNGNVAWVSLPSSKPQLVILAQINTIWKPQPSTSGQQSSEDTLVVLERQDVGQKWRIVAYPTLDPSSTTQLQELHQLKSVYPMKSSSALPVPPSSLATKYWSYVSGSADAPFSPGPFTDQLRAGFQQDARSASQAGGSMTFPLEAGAGIGSYAVGGSGDALIFFGLRYATVQDAPNGGCIVQSATERGLPSIVPDGRYQQVRLEYRAIDVALENKSSGTIAVLGSYAVLVGESTTQTTAPACL